MRSWQLELIDPRELAIILQDVFGSESVIPGSRVTTFGSNAGYQVQIEFGKTGRPLKCQAHRTPATVLQRIAERIQIELVETAGYRIGRSIVMLGTTSIAVGVSVTNWPSRQCRKTWRVNRLATLGPPRPSSSVRSRSAPMSA